MRTGRLKTRPDARSQSPVYAVRRARYRSTDTVYMIVAFRGDCMTRSDSRADDRRLRLRYIVRWSKHSHCIDFCFR